MAKSKKKLSRLASRLDRRRAFLLPPPFFSRDAAYLYLLALYNVLYIIISAYVALLAVVRLLHIIQLKGGGATSLPLPPENCVKWAVYVA